MTATFTETEIDPVTGSGRVAHIVKPDGDKSASALVTEARVFGNEVEALCGHRWVPERDPKQYPVCQACKEAFEELGRQHGWNPDDGPSDG